MPRRAPTLDQLRTAFPHWEKIKDVIDQCIDIMLNHRQSGHPGGSRSKVHALVTTLLSGAMRWDLREPGKRFADRFVLVAGHTVPLVYATLAVFNEALHERYKRTGDRKYLVNHFDEQALLAKHLLDLRRNKGLSGHAEMEGRTLFFKANTGPSGHGSPAAAGAATALKLAGASEVRVFAFEGEGGHTTGATHETKNTAWGLGLENLVYVLDWNDYGIDPNPNSSVVYGDPDTWFRSYGWKTAGAPQGSEWESVAMAFHEGLFTPNPDKLPICVWVKTVKGRGYGVTGYKSHGKAHERNSDAYWATKKEFADKYGVQFDSFGKPDPKEAAEARRQAAANFEIALDVIRNDPACLEYLTDRLVELGDSVPEELPGCRVDGEVDPAKDPVVTDWRAYPDALFLKPGEKSANGKGFATYGAWLNAHGRKRYGRPLVVACSADLAESTNIAGFSKDFGDVKGYGWYDRNKNLEGCLLPQQITEFTNSGLVCGLATVNLSRTPYKNFSGFWGACSTYGSFSYLKYGPMRLFSQLAQDSQLKVGKVIWVAGHSGPETAEDSRTHFGIYEPSVCQLFPQGHVINIYPYEHNEVAPLLGAALATEAPIVALHLTRPPVTIPDRAALGMAHYLEAAHGAYLVRDYAADRPRGGCLFVQGTSCMAEVVKLLFHGDFDRAGLNVKIVAVPSYDLFRRQPAEWRQSLVSDRDWADSTVIANCGRKTMSDWIAHRISAEYAMTPDFDDRWRTGGSVEEIIEESHLSAPRLLDGITRFVRDRDKRFARLRHAVD
ncbi:MAG TPA: transketolase [Planctomycetota bacterium]|nr:transketolase [Planctomycetota bacterium]